MNLIKLKNIYKTYRSGDVNHQVLNHINLEIDQGEMIAIMGPSGSGKSTLLHILGCLDNFDQGEYFFKEKLINSLQKKELARLRNKEIGFIFQQFALFADSNVLENVEMPLLYANKHDKVLNKLKSLQIRDKCLAALNDVDMIEHKDKIAYQLSGGQQQRVAIARAIVNDPALILADEPTGALDRNTGRNIMSLFKRLNNQGKTIVIITHDAEVASYCNRIIQIEDGNINH